MIKNSNYRIFVFFVCSCFFEISQNGQKGSSKKSNYRFFFYNVGTYKYKVPEHIAKISGNNCHVNYFALLAPTYSKHTLFTSLFIPKSKSILYYITICKFNATKIISEKHFYI